MAFVVVTSNSPQANELRQLKDALIRSYESAANINRQLDEMDDTQVTAQYGVPSGTVATFRSNIDTLIAGLESSAVTNVISSLGFDR